MQHHKRFQHACPKCLGCVHWVERSSGMSDDADNDNTLPARGREQECWGMAFCRRWMSLGCPEATLDADLMAESSQR